MLGFYDGTGIELRNKIIDFVEANPEFMIGGMMTLRDYIFYEKHITLEEYSAMMRRTAFGGAIEIQLCCEMYKINVVVYQLSLTSGLYESMTSFGTKIEEKDRIIKDRIIFGDDNPMKYSASVREL